jgi:hypothetical protein
MKSIIFSILIVIPCHAGFVVPKNVYRSDQIEAAQAEAEKEKRGLAFLYSNPKSTCPLCDAASEEAFKKLRTHSVIVLLDVNDKNAWDQVNPVVTTGFHEPQMGHVYPKVVITSPDMKAIVAQLSNKEMGSSNMYSTAKKHVEAMLKLSTSPELDINRISHWKSGNSSGFYIGTYTGMKDEKTVNLKMKSDGKTYAMDLNRFNPATAAFLKELAENKKPAKATVNNVLENWTGSNGTTLQAKFVSLKDDKVTLEMESGKTHTLSLERLDKTSQDKAKSYATEKP